MSDVTGKITVYFENPFWVAVYERAEKGNYTVAKVVFGAEPTDNEVYEYFLRNWKRLKFSPPMKVKNETERKINPKRMQREIKRQMNVLFTGTKSQQALKLQQELNKTERKSRSRQQHEAEKKRKFELRQEKKLKKKKGH